MSDGTTRRKSGLKLRQAATGLWRVTGLVFLVAFGCWAAGIVLPVLHVTELFVFENEVSLLGIVQGLIAEGEIFIGVLVLLFTLLLPPAKLLLGAGLWHLSSAGGMSARRGVMWLDAIGKWAMLDVLILALVVVMLKSNWMADAQAGSGLYFFAASAILSMIAGHGLRLTVRSAT